MEIIQSNITNYFNDLLVDLKCHQDTKAYIISIYLKYRSSEFDLSKDSVTLLFTQAHKKQDFLIYQNLGDWIFFSNSIAPQHLKNASKDYYDNIAKSSYYACYKLINRQWKLFEQLADEFSSLTNDANILLKRKIALK